MRVLEHFARTFKIETLDERSEPPGSIRSLAPTLGQHTDAVLADLGYTTQDVARWRAEGAIR